MQPEVIGQRYRVERAIGQGGMGTVWLCQDDVLHRRVAVKQVGLLPGESATDSARAFREARSSAALSHRNVVTVFDVVEEDGRIWLVMEYVPGRSLSEMINQAGALDPAVVADIGAQVAGGLAAAHVAGTTHRDVKPGNVLVSDEGIAKISDFGIARTSGDPTLTQSGMVTGTPHYFSPDLARGGEPSAANDVWALGATLYAAVEGVPPFRASPNPVGVLHEIATRPPPRATRAAFLAPALERMLDPDAASRWSMDDCAHVLDRLAKDHRRENTLHSTRPEGAVVPATAVEPTPDPEPTYAPPRVEPADEGATASAPLVPRPPASRPGRKRSRAAPVLVGLLAVLVAVVGVLAARQLSGSDQESPPASAGRDQGADGQGGGDPDNSNPDNGDQGSGDEGGSSSPEAAKEQLVRDYYAAAPGGTDEAWAMLGPGMQEQGRDNYDSFWRSIEAVDVQSVETTPGSDTVNVSLVYRTNDGRTSTERKVEGLVESDDGGYLIDSDEPAG
ncbi:MAG: protein kinase [Marmoricola sp.]